MVGGHNSVMPRRPVYPLGKGDSWMATIIECIESHYEAQRMPYGKACVSYLECVMVECACTESLVLTASEAVCRCIADHTALVREERASDGGTPEMRSTASGGRSETNTFGRSITTG
jgi:hypothetical protein